MQIDAHTLFKHTVPQLFKYSWFLSVLYSEVAKQAASWENYGKMTNIQYG